MYGPTIGALLAEGAIAGIWDGRSGHWRDLSGNGNHGTLSAGMRQIGPGGPWVFPNITDKVTVADAASLQLVALGIVAYSEHGFTSQVAMEALVSKRDGGGSNYGFYFNNAQFSFYDGAAFRTLAYTAIAGKKALGISVVAGSTPVGYVDGLSVGNYSGVSNPAPYGAPLEIGNILSWNRLRSPLSALLLANRVLDATEHAAVYAELAAMRWPSKQFGMAKRVQGSVIGEANLLAGYTLRPTGGTVPSHDGAFTGTLSGNAMAAESILGPALAMGRTTGAVDLGVGNAQINPTTDSHWVEVWARPLDVAMSDLYAPIIGKGLAGGLGLWINGGVVQCAPYYECQFYDTETRRLQSTGAIPRNKLTHVVYTVDYANMQVYLYVDGVQYGPQAMAAGFWAPALATNWVVGKCGSTVFYLDEGFGGLVVCPRIGTGVLTPAQVQARYLLGARAVQFKTDWAYPISVANEGGVTGQQIGGFASPFRAGDATGRWAIETDTVDGKLCKVLTCKTTGSVYVPASYFGMGTTPTEAAYGTWEWWAYKADASVFDVNFIATVNTGITTGYGLKWAADESVVVYEYGVGNVVAGGSASHSTWHRFRLTRSIAGLFTGYIDGVSFGSGTDTTTTTSYYWAFDMDAGDKIALGDTVGDHCIAKMLGVVAP